MDVIRLWFSFSLARLLGRAYLDPMAWNRAQSTHIPIRWEFPTLAIWCFFFCITHVRWLHFLFGLVSKNDVWDYTAFASAWTKLEPCLDVLVGSSLFVLNYGLSLVLVTVISTYVMARYYGG